MTCGEGQQFLITPVLPICCCLIYFLSWFPLGWQEEERLEAHWDSEQPFPKDRLPQGARAGWLTSYHIAELGRRDHGFAEIHYSHGGMNYLF